MNVEQPLVSIVTPVFNAGAFLQETAESVQAQQVARWEWLLVDDGSRDDSWEVLQALAERDGRVRVFRRRTNSGLPAVPRNEALAHARGRFVAFIDADDLWFAGKLRAQLQLFRQHAPRWQFSNSVFLHDEGNRQPHQKFHPRWRPPSPFWPEALDGDGVPFLTVLAERELLLSLTEGKSRARPFDEAEALRGVEDWDLVLRLGRRARPGYIATPLAAYRVHPEGISRDREGAFRAAEALIRKHREAEAPADVCRRASRRQRSKRAVAGLLAGERGLRTTLLRETLGGRPTRRDLWLALLAFLPVRCARSWYRLGLGIQRGRTGRN